MKKFDIFGVGNALVDIEFRLDTEKLERLDLPKGMMTLVSDSKQREVLRAINLKSKEVKQSCGGSVANSLATASILGSKTFFSFRVAEDRFGDLFCKELRLAKIDMAEIKSRHPGNTGTCLTLVTEDADRTMATHLGVTEDISSNDLDFDAIAKSRHAYIEGYLVSNGSGFEAARAVQEAAKESGTVLALTLSDPGIVENFKTEFETLVENGVDLVFCNFSEAKLLTREDNLEGCKRKMREIVPRFVITLGENGSYAFDGKFGYSSQSPKVRAQDSTGAGDTFAGAFLHCISKSKGYDEANKISNRFASEVVRTWGARLPNDTIKSLNAEIKATL
ncbi:adenosine kinase [Gammaproteobacteria bacterium]|nr:adenosine kinase [Gammaproteobacteria bacterium]